MPARNNGNNGDVTHVYESDIRQGTNPAVTDSCFWFPSDNPAVRSDTRVAADNAAEPEDSGFGLVDNGYRLATAACAGVEQQEVDTGRNAADICIDQVSSGLEPAVVD